MNIKSKNDMCYACYKVKDKARLIDIIYDFMSEDAYGHDVALNWLDVSAVTDMSSLFSDKHMNNHFDGNISLWDVSNVEDMTDMFSGSDFMGNISKWKIARKCDITNMFPKGFPRQHVPSSLSGKRFPTYLNESFDVQNSIKIA